MRILIVTDSLGIPRENISIEDCWVDKLVSDNNNNTFYTLMLPGLSLKKIYEYRDIIMELYKPDIIIFQFGIVDACRRAPPDTIKIIISRIKILSMIFRPLISKFRFTLTRIFKFHRMAPKEFSKSLHELVSYGDLKAKIYFISIAPAGEFLAKKTYNIDNDIEHYNSILKKICDDARIFFVNPYRGHDKNEIVMKDDGHHLTQYGHMLVFNKIKSVLKLH